MKPSHKMILATIGAAFALLVTLAAFMIQLHRYNYDLQGREGGQYLVRMDRLTGTSCYVSVGYAGDQVASQVLVLGRCEP